LECEVADVSLQARTVVTCKLHFSHDPRQRVEYRIAITDLKTLDPPKTDLLHEVNEPPSVRPEVGESACVCHELRAPFSSRMRPIPQPVDWKEFRSGHCSFVGQVENG